MNEMVGTKNPCMMSGGKKRLVCPFTRQDFWKCIGLILLVVTHGKKGHKILSEIQYFLVRIHQLNYKEMSVGKQIYIRYVVISIVLITVMLDI